jgi:hypothetical protein
MSTQNQVLVDTRIKQYLINKVKETFPEDYHLIESSIEDMVTRYSLKELIMYARIEIQQIHNKRHIRF